MSPPALPKPNVGLLQENIQSALEVMRSYVDAASEISPSEFQGLRFLTVVRRAVLRRQFDSLEAISHLVFAGRGHAAPPLLRPSCDELIWVSYLDHIDESDAEELVRCKVVFDELELLEAQHSFAGKAVMEGLDLLEKYRQLVADKKDKRARVRALGRKLGWPSKAIQEARSPSASWLAKETGREDIYEYIHCATSHFVQFSAQGLHRMARYERKGISVRSVHFQDYWGAFSLQWGFHLLIESAIHLSATPGMPQGKMSVPDLLSASGRIAAFGKVPVITADELWVPR